MKRKITKQHAGSMLLMSVLILASVFTVAMAISSISLAQTRMGGEQARSTKAYFAAEAGAERVIYEIRKNGFYPNFFCDNGDLIGFSGNDPLTSEISRSDDACDGTEGDDNEVQLFSSGSSYNIRYDFIAPDTTLTVTGSYGGTNRLIELEY